MRVTVRLHTVAGQGKRKSGINKIKGVKKVADYEIMALLDFVTVLIMAIMALIITYKEKKQKKQYIKDCKRQLKRCLLVNEYAEFMGVASRAKEWTK